MSRKVLVWDHVAMFKVEDKPEVDMVFGARVGLLGRDIRRSMKRHFATLGLCTTRVRIEAVSRGRRGDLETVMPFHTRWVFDEMIGEVHLAGEQNGAKERDWP